MPTSHSRSTAVTAWRWSGPTGPERARSCTYWRGSSKRRARSTSEAPSACSRRRRSACPAEQPLLAWFREQTALPEDEARTLLAHYRLGAEAIGRPLGRLSPGERSRVHVAAIVGAGAELILLDEPTNHLDFDTLEVIEAALNAYRGTLVIATHDRRLIEAVGCDRVLEVAWGSGARRAAGRDRAGQPNSAAISS